jgi:hypothetical protein
MDMVAQSKYERDLQDLISLSFLFGLSGREF